MRRLTFLAGLGFLSIAFGACSSPRSKVPDVTSLYREAALREPRNPVIVIHGILGARLEQRSTGKIVWGAFTSEAINPGTPEGARALALPLKPVASAFDYTSMKEDVYATGPLEALELGIFFQVLSVDVYANILRSLGAGGFRDNVVVDRNTPAYSKDHYTCFTFFYDWRRDNVENAIALGRFLETSREDIKRKTHRQIDHLRESRNPDDVARAGRLEAWLERGFRFDIVAHSMGGLIARYYLRYGANDLPPAGQPLETTWAGADEIDRMVLIGTPNLGSMDALRNLIEGFSPSVILPFFNPTLLGSMPSIYQLLPRSGARLVLDGAGREVELDLFDPAVWEANGWGLLGEENDPYLAWLLPDVATAAERRSTARRYLAWCLGRARRFNKALDLRPKRPCPIPMRLFASDTEDTLAKCRLERRGDRLIPTFVGSSLNLPGDATVTRYSALADQRIGMRENTSAWLRSPITWESVTFLPDDHVGLTMNPLFTNNLLFFLLEQEPRQR